MKEETKNIINKKSMKSNMYERMPKWRIILPSIFFIPAELILIVFMATTNLLAGLMGLMVFLPLDLWVAALYYNFSKAYMEIDGNTIYITDYPFFKERKRTVALSEIKKIKFRQYKSDEWLVFKSHKNKTLFRTGDLFEIRYYFRKLGFIIKSW